MTTAPSDALALADFIQEHPRLVVLTGAGISLDSGIPTYRDEAGNWMPQPPIQERAFLQEPATRRRYWARSYYGWPTIRDAQPNGSHSAIAWLEAHNKLDLLITQNVDGLHQRAGSSNVVDLHGRVDHVRCLRCDALHCRNHIQSLLEEHNEWPQRRASDIRPDGDMEIQGLALDSITTPLCPNCGGDLRPDVVFFGGSVPHARVNACHQAIEQADALLVVGSSLMVFSGYRFCRRASELKKPITIVNTGLTRGDSLAQTKIQTPAGPLLTDTVALLQE